MLVIHEEYSIGGSQGNKQIAVDNTFELSSDRSLLTYTMRRSSRKTGPVLTYVLKRADANNAYVYQMSDDWDIQSGLGKQACFISLQGIVNEAKPNLYFIYGPKYAFNYTGELFQLPGKREALGLPHETFASLEQALRSLQETDQRVHRLGHQRPHIPDRGLHMCRARERHRDP